MMENSFLPPGRSFLGPHRPTWSDFQRLRTLKQMEHAMRLRIAILEALPKSRRILAELKMEVHHLELVRREIRERKNLLAEL